MQSLVKYPIIFFAAYVATALLTPLVISLCRWAGLLDHPDERRIHQEPVPRGGGLAIFFGFHIACAIRFLYPWAPFEGELTIEWWKVYIPLSALLLVTGLIDDARGIRPLPKFVAQWVVASVLFIIDVRMGKLLGVELPLVVDYCFTMLWLVGITNAFNLIDGLDGLASGLALIASVGIGSTLLLRGLPGDALVFVALAGSCAAFLRYNFSPAQIFLGDSGSMFLGMTIATCALETGSKGTTAAALGVPVLAVGIPLFDTALAIWRRSVRKMLATDDARNSRISAADMEHVHHRLLRLGYSHRRAAILLYSSASLMIGIGLLSVVYHSHALGIYLLAFALGAYVVVRHVASVELWDSAAVLARGLRRLPTPVRAFVAYPILDFCALTLSLAAALILSSDYDSTSTFRAAWYAHIPVWCGLSFLALFLSRTYSKVWSRARISDFGFLSIALMLSGICSLALMLLEPQTALRETFAVGCVYFGISTTILCGLRALPRIVQDLQSLFASPYGVGTINVLLYGADFSALMYLRYHSLAASADESSEERKSTKVIGYVDDDRNLRDRIVYGYRVLGIGDEIPQIITKHRIGRVVVLSRSLPERIAALIPPNVEVRRFEINEFQLTHSEVAPDAKSQQKRYSENEGP